MVLAEGDYLYFSMAVVVEAVEEAFNTFLPFSQQRSLPSASLRFYKQSEAARS